MKTTILLVTLALLSCACVGDDDDARTNSVDDDTSIIDDDNDTSDDSVDDDDTLPNTWIDPNTLLEWQDPPNDSGVNWYEATAYCDTLNLDGHDDWRLPTISELRTLIVGCAATETGGECKVTDECLDIEDCFALDNDASGCSHNDCDFGNGPNNGCFQRIGLTGECLTFWSSSPGQLWDGRNRAWGIVMMEANVGPLIADESEFSGTAYSARCVR